MGGGARKTDGAYRRSRKHAALSALRAPTLVIKTALGASLNRGGTDREWRQNVVGLRTSGKARKLGGNVRCRGKQPTVLQVQRVSPLLVRARTAYGAGLGLHGRRSSCPPRNYCTTNHRRRCYCKKRKQASQVREEQVPRLSRPHPTKKKTRARLAFLCGNLKEACQLQPTGKAAIDRRLSVLLVVLYQSYHYSHSE